MKTSYLKWITILFALSVVFYSCEEDDETVETNPEPETPVNDTLLVVIPAGTAANICLDDQYDLNELDNSAVCDDGGLNVTVNDLDLCVDIENISFDGIPDTLCVYHCNASNLCDTTYVVVFVCEDCFELNECFPYMPSSVSSSETYNWSEPNEEDTFYGLLQTPSDPGGGYWNISVSTDGPAVPFLIVSTDVDEPGAIISGSSLGTTSEQNRRAKFTAYPNVSYSLKVEPFVEGNTEEYPWEYNISYDFVSVVDCYEPNDGFDQAKYVPKGQQIDAYALAGHINDNLPTGANHTQDWYKVTITSAEPLRAELLQCPPDIRMDIDIFDSDNSAVGATFNLTSGGLNDNGRLFYVESTQVLDPGTYYLKFRTENAIRKVNHDDPLPLHWGTPYSFMISTP